MHGPSRDLDLLLRAQTFVSAEIAFLFRPGGQERPDSLRAADQPDSGSAKHNVPGERFIPFIRIFSFAALLTAALTASPAPLHFPFQFRCARSGASLAHIEQNEDRSAPMKAFKV
jgi:hypothetical protein